MRSRIRGEQSAHLLHIGRNLLEHTQPLAAHRGLEVLKSGDIAAWPRKACDKTAVHRLRHLREHDRNRAFQPVKLGKGQIARSNDRVRCGLHQFCRESADLLPRVACAPTIVKPDIALFIPAQITKRLAEGFEADLSRSVIFRVRRQQHSDASHARAPLRAR